MELVRYIETIPDWPKPGILFRDITPVLANPEAMSYVCDKFTQFIHELKADFVLAPEARGFLFGVPASLQAKVGFAPVRKPGKLPREQIKEGYDLEYGVNELCLHVDALKPGMRVVVIDDLLATGGTVEATIKLAHRLKAEVVGCAFVIELDDLKGRDRLKDLPILSLTHFEGE